MQSNRKEIEVKNNGIDLTETATFGKNKKYDDPFHPDSEGYWLFKVPNNEKLRILLEKVNQNDGYFRFHSIDHIVETIFNSSNGQFLTKKRYAEKRINDIPEIKQQYVIDEKLKTFNEIEELKKVLKGIEPSEDCFLDLDQSKEVLIECTFPPLGFKTVKEIEIYLLSLIAYRGNLLYINYLKQLSAPAPKAEAQGKRELGRPKNTNETFDNKCYRMFTELTVTKLPVITAMKAKNRLLTLLKDDLGENEASNKAQINRAIRNGKANNN